MAVNESARALDRCVKRLVVIFLPFLGTCPHTENQITRTGYLFKIKKNHNDQCRTPRLKIQCESKRMKEIKKKKATTAVHITRARHVSNKHSRHSGDGKVGLCARPLFSVCVDGFFSLVYDLFFTALIFFYCFLVALAKPGGESVYLSYASF